jgi:oxygen-independent coproporphyrinogen-3 oxidase
MPCASWLTPALDEDWRQGGFGLYVHWPFCAAKCPYCDFNSHVARSIDHNAWLSAYRDEIAKVSAKTGPRVLNSIFFGGGTPSLMEPDTVAAVIEAARDGWHFANDIEITLEANPGSVEAGRFAAYRDAGVNRVSMGIQALNDRDLRALGRIHSVAEARAAFDVARHCFDRVSFDLIYARQGQTLADWKAELTEALAMSIDHLSLYQLTIEDGTAFGDRYRAGKLRGLPSEDTSADMYDLTQEVCEAAGMPRYEVSNHARPGSESRHNLIYWRYGDYAGVGPGAHGRLSLNGNKYASAAISNPNMWLKSPDTREVFSPLTAEEQAEEMLLMGLRLSEGIPAGRFEQLCGAPLSTSGRALLEDMDLIRQSGNRIQVTSKGFPLLNQVIAKLLD